MSHLKPGVVCFLGNANSEMVMRTSTSKPKAGIYKKKLDCSLSMDLMVRTNFVQRRLVGLFHRYGMGLVGMDLFSLVQRVCFSIANKYFLHMDGVVGA